MLKKFALTVAAATLALSAAPALAAPPPPTTTVSGLSSTPVFLANLMAGTTYTVTATGSIDLFGNFNSAAGLSVDPDGKPLSPFPAPYTGYNPNGTVSDGGVHGIAYNFNLGALVGTFTPTPDTSPTSTDFFLLGSSRTLTPTSNVTLYGVANDAFCCFFDNDPGESFSVSVVAQAITSGAPEPGTWAMMLLGFGLTGSVLRRRRSMTTAIAAA